MGELSIITLTTDFGLVDGYVATMKGVMLGIAPCARFVDITHAIEPQAIQQTAYVLYSTYPYFPASTVHLVVVDPGVGGARRPIALQSPHGTFVGPDNGVFTYVTAEESAFKAVELANRRYQAPAVSRTFHGRDVFAPAAAHLAAGVPIDEFGQILTDPVTMPLPRLDVGAQEILGEVIHTDHFGNVVTSIGRLHWGEEDVLLLRPAFRRQAGERTSFSASKAVVVAAGRELRGIHAFYADVEPGEPLALVNSRGHLEIAVRQGNARRRLALQAGDPVQLRW